MSPATANLISVMIDVEIAKKALKELNHTELSMIEDTLVLQVKETMT